MAINQLRKSIIGPQFQGEILSGVDAIVSIQQRMDAVSRNLQFDFKFGFDHRTENSWRHQNDQIFHMQIIMENLLVANSLNFFWNLFY